MVPMEIKEVIKERHSVRQYKKIPVDAAIIEKLEAEIKKSNEESGLHFQLIFDEPECFNTFMAHYGRFKNVSNYLALVGKKSETNLDQLCGYFGERFVLLAQELGLNTCWVAGTFGRGKCKAVIQSDEKLVCVIAFGYGENTGRPHKSKAEKKLCDIPEAERPDWFKEGLEAAILAPTALNQQKFFVSIADGEPVITSKNGPMTQLDLGIVKYNFEAVSGHKCK